jgi:Fe-S cluster assembly scaffold protein SufB
LIEFLNNSKISKNIQISNNWKINYLLIIDWNNDIDININFESKTIWKIQTIIISKNNKTNINLKINISWNNSKVNVYMLSLIWNNWDIKIDWGITIWKKVNNSEWNLLQENLILGKNTKIQVTPNLDINSNNIIASHWAKIEDIDKNKIFYIMSKWISKQKSSEIIIEWYIHNIFKTFKDTETLKKLKKEIIEKVK